MTSAHADDSPDAEVVVVTPEIAAEASVWIARLHGPDRSAAMERECLDWQARSAAHRLAFERCTEVWQAVPQVRLADAYASVSSGGERTAAPQAGGFLKGGRWLFASALLLAGIVVGISLWRGDADDMYVTRIGEQRLVVLDDGTRMSLNTNTSVRVALSRTRRLVKVESGEALFEVASDATRPFVVRAAGSEVVAVGTVFSVQVTGASEANALAVTLIEGRVSVRSATADGPAGLAPAKEVQMQAGERMRLARSPDPRSGPAKQLVDRPQIEQLLAWKRNEVIFDDVSLADAVAEMNRYSRTPIVIPGSLSNLRVSGQYRTGDSAGFARAVAALHGLHVRDRDGRLELATPQ
jgi:transmembrane sensor